MIRSERSKNNNFKYLKLYNWGKTLILSGVIKKGEKFPSEHMLTKKFGYSRQTVRAALKMLVDEKLLYKSRGSGTYVLYDIKSSKGSHKKIGLILSYFADYLFPHIYDGIESVMKEKGIGIDVNVTKNRLNDETAFLEKFLYSDISGLIVEGTKSSFPNPNVKLYEKLIEKNIPIIFIHNHYSNIKFDSIEMSDEKCSYELTKRLLINGHRKISAVFKYDDYQGIERYKGFMKCMNDYDVPLDDDLVYWYSTKDMDHKFSKSAMARMMKKNKECTAIFTYNNEIADIIIEFLVSKGMSVPQDLSIVSFDDELSMNLSGLRVLSAVHPKYELGKLAARNLIKMMEDKDWRANNYSYKFPVVLNEGNSLLRV